MINKVNKITISNNNVVSINSTAMINGIVTILWQQSVTATTN